MKTQARLAFLAASIVFLVQLTIAQAPQFTPFSADMQFASARNTSTPRDMSGKIYMNHDHMRMEVGPGARAQSIIITDLASKTVDILMPSQHIYMEHHVDETQGGRAQAWNDVKPLRDPNNPCAGQPGTSCKKIGVEEVNGRSCDHWEITDKNGNVSNVWVDQKIHFPIRTVSGETSWQLTNIQEGEPAASLFQVPSDYHKMDMGQMMRGAPPQQ